MVENITVAVGFDGIVEKITIDGRTNLMAYNRVEKTQRWFPVNNLEDAKKFCWID